MPKSLRARKFIGLGVLMKHLAPNACLIKLTGEVDQATYKELNAFIDENLFDEEDAVIVDMTELDFMDSSGVKFIQRLAHGFGYDNVAIYGMNEDLTRILDIVGLERKI